MEREVVLRTQGLTRSFGRAQVVKDVALELPRGEVYGFLGRNGAGKTTTLRMLMGIIGADSGEFELLGERTRKIEARHRARLGYVSQEQNFYSWMTATELGGFVAGFFPTWDGPEFRRLLRRLDVPADRKSEQLSGGMRAKLALALALAHRPEVLLLDEPTAGLDPVARREFLDILKNEVRARGQSVLFSSHLVGEVEDVSQRIGILQDGQLRYQGSITTLRDEVRRVRFAERPPVLEGVELIRNETSDPKAFVAILRAGAERWDELAPVAERLDLESIFLAYARQSAA